MDTGDAALLLGAGLAAGTVNAIAGGGSLITFPSLLATGLPPVTANVTNALAVFPGYVASVAGSRADLAGQDARLRTLLPAAVLGTILGTTLLLVFPARAFELVIPFLVLTASLVLAFQTRLQALVGHPRQLAARRQAVSLQLLTVVGAAYGGYFGGALGVILVAVLGLVLDERMQRIGALKNALSAVVGLVTAMVFVLFGPVHWLSVVVLAPATVVGGYLGARLARRMPAAVLRWTVVAFGMTVSAVLMVRTFG